ncbi:Transposon TX1 uncharacterized 149 kDa protein [Linum perenne]
MDCIFSWNCRGAGSDSFLIALRHYLQVFKPPIVATLEPQISGEQGRDVRKKLNFQHSFIVEAQGFHGGIWLLWNDDNFKLEVLSSSNQLIRTIISWDQGACCCATFIYASPALHLWRALWTDIRRLCSSINEAWILLGDFNAMTSPSEKNGGAKFNHIPSREFRECISDCSLFDTGFVGPKFTWFRQTLKERLDRCLCNVEWMNLIQDSTTMLLERLQSDHRPILVRLTHQSRFNRLSRPFHFNAAWLAHENFPSFLDHNWSRGRELSVSLQDFKDKCKTWNVEVFGHIFKRKRQLQNHLRWLEHKCQNTNADKFVKEEAEIRTELERTLWQESILWLQKSRIQWIKDGDRNTKFFHLSTIGRRNVNFFRGLKRPDGNEIFEDSELKQLALTHFQDLFTAGRTQPLPMGFANFAQPLSEADKSRLVVISTKQEILLALKSMGGLKALGKDGFHPIFF